MAVPKLYDYTAPTETPEQRLAVLVLALAVKDARQGIPAARLWLWSDDAAWWAKLAGFDEWPCDAVLKGSGLC